MGIFQKLLDDGIARGHIPGKTQTARNWYRNKAKDFQATIRKDETRVDYGRNIDKKLMKENMTSQKTQIIPGQMYMYYYDPKYKEELPFYDKFPLIFPFRVKSDRFWGLNLHYLPLPLRAKLMDELYDLSNNKRYDETTKLKLSWQLLNASSKVRYIDVCVKQYLKSHTRSKFLLVEPEYWDTAIFLPAERFEKKSKSSVWAESKRKLGVTK